MIQLKDSVKEALTLIKEELQKNSGKLSKDFIDWYAENKCSYEFGKIGDSARVCILTTSTGHKIIGHALVLDPKNDVEEIGNSVAQDNCKNELWGFLGWLAKMIDNDSTINLCDT